MYWLAFVLALVSAAPRPAYDRVKVYEVTTMADTESVWKSGGSGDWNVAANWSNGIPGTTAADLVAVFDGTSQVSLTTNLDQSGAAQDFKVRQDRSYFGDIGAPGNPLVVKAATAILAATLKGSGNTYIEFGTAAVVNHCIIDCGPGYVDIGIPSGASTSVSPLMVKSGRVNIRGGLGNYYFQDGYNSDVVIEATTAARMKVSKGKLTCKGNFVGAANKFFSVRAAEVVMTGLLTTETLVDVNGGYFSYNPLNDPSAETPDIFVASGVFDASEYPGSIPTGQVILGNEGTLLGTFIDQSAGLIDYDLSEEWP